MKHFLLLILLSTLIGSCSITKRRYNSGWHVEWHKKHHDSNPETVVENDRSVRFSETSQVQDSAAESRSRELQIATESETISLIEESESVFSTSEDTPSPSEFHPDATTSDQTPTSIKAVSENEPDEPKKEAFPNSERVIPIPLAIILSILLFVVGFYISSFVGAIVYLALTFSFGYSLIASAIAIFFGALMLSLFFILIFHLYNRKETKYASKRERNLMYIWYAFAVSFGIGLVIWLVSIGLNR